MSPRKPSVYQLVPIEKFEDIQTRGRNKIGNYKTINIKSKNN